MISIAPVRKQILVSASQERAFVLFTSGMSQWWPATHSTLKSPLKQYIVEPQEGGRWYAVGEDGSTAQTGYVIEWQPPQRVVLAWQLNADWQYDPNLVTEVEVRFITESAHSTRIELEHRLLERMGDRGSQVRTMIDAPGGWGLVLEAFKKFTDTKGDDRVGI
ncbi:MAG TPA: SRPBCC family protein [Steroidobacteraceae bacterium]